MKNILLYLTLVPLFLLASCDSGSAAPKGKLSSFEPLAAGTLRASVMVTSDAALYPEPLGVRLRLDQSGDVLSLSLTDGDDQVIAGPVELAPVVGSGSVVAASGVSLFGFDGLSVQVSLLDAAATGDEVSILIRPEADLDVRAQQLDEARLARLRLFIAYFTDLGYSGQYTGAQRFAMLIQQVFDHWLMIGDGGRGARDAAIDDLLDMLVGAAFQDIKNFLTMHPGGALLPGDEVIKEGRESLTGFTPELQEGEGRFRHFITNAAAMRYDWTFGLLTNIAARLNGGDWWSDDPDVRADVATNAIGRDFHDFVFGATREELQNDGIRDWVLDRIAADPTTTDFRLEVVKEGDGSGVVTGAVAGIACGSTCTADVPALTAVTLTAVADPGSVFVEFLSDCSGTDCTVVMDRNRKVTAVFELDEDQAPPTEPINFPGLLRHFGAVESLARILFPPLPTQATACPTVAAAGTGGVMIQELCVGGEQRLLERAGATLYDAQFLFPPAGSDWQVGLVTSGQGYSVCHLNDEHEIEGLCLISPPGAGQITDSTLIGNDPASGALLLNRSNNRLLVARHHPETGFVNVNDFLPAAQTPPGAASAIAGPGGSYVLVAANGALPGEPGQLFYLDLSQDPVVPQLIGELAGPVPRRIRCDFESAVCAVSDFQASRLSIINWDGTSMPELTGATPEGELSEGPVGIDVLGNLVVSAGYTSNEFSITLLGESGEVQSVTTRVLPEDCLQPGHAIFLRDAGRSVVLSCHGSNSLMLFPQAFD